MLFILLLAIAIFICYIRFAPKTIELTKYIEISYDGYDGNAKANASLNEDELKKIIKDKDVAKELIDELEIEIKNNSKCPRCKNELHKENEKKKSDKNFFKKILYKLLKK